MIKNLIFDLGGVIVPLHPMACITAFKEVIGYEGFGEFLSMYRHKGFFDQFERGEISSREFRKIIRKNAMPVKKLNGKSKSISDNEIDYCLNRFLLPIPQNRIEALLFFRHDYRMLMLSNTNPIGMDRCRELFRDMGYETEDLFEKLYLSYKMKLAKPDPEIFAELIKDSGVVPEETLYIDDSMTNIKAGAEFGFRTLLYNTKDDLYAKVCESIERE